MSLFIRVERFHTSHYYKRNQLKDDDWLNNDAHNCEDNFKLFSYEDLIFKAKCQSISNIPGGKYEDSIAEGPFQIKCFVDKRMFYPRIHGICNTFDLGFEHINENSIEPTDSNRWLIHDDQKLKPNPPGIITRVCWSAGCIVLHKSDLEALNQILDAYKIQPGDKIDAELVEV